MPANKTDRKFMEMAVAEMRKSRSEHAHARDPLVGAVLVGKGLKLLGAAHRGDLRVGDHAEFTLIERYLPHRSLEGATLYVTLEPCTRRSERKTPCAQRVVNARIGRAFIGMTDPNPNICGRGVQHLLDNGVEVDFFDLDLVRQIREENQGFIDYYETGEGGAANANEPFEGPSPYELVLIERARLEDLSHDAMQRYLSKRQIEVGVPSAALWRIMERTGYIGRNSKGRLCPTIAGIALFATAPAEILPQCRVSIEARKAGRRVSDDFEGPLLLFRDHLDKFFQDQMRHFTEIREYDRVEIKSPGGLLKPLSLTRVRTFNAPPYSRNPHMALAIHRMGWIEEKGSGLARMRDSMLGHGLRPPAFDFRDGYFIVSLPGQAQAWSNVRVSPDTLAALDAPHRELVELVLAGGPIGTKASAAKLRVSVATARRYLSSLVQQGIFATRGKGSRLCYQLAGSE